MTLNFSFSMTSRALTLKRALQILASTMPQHSRPSESELLLISHFFSLPSRYEFHRFSRAAKKEVIKIYKDLYGEDLTVSNIHSKFYALISKGWLQREEDREIRAPDKISAFTKAVIEAYEKDERFTFVFSFNPSKDEAISSSDSV